MAEKAWRKVARDMGLKDLRLHDFRRTVASRVYEHTKDLKLCKAILNHFDSDVTSIYVRLNYDYIARELQANADRFWAIKQEVTRTDVHATDSNAPGVGGPRPNHDPAARGHGTGPVDGLGSVEGQRPC
jgi:hypothetical protein